MAIGTATDWKVVVNGTDLSGWAHEVAIDDTRAKLEASTFNPFGNRRYVPGLRDQSVTITFYMDRAAGGPYQVIKNLYESGTSFPFYVQPDSDTALGTTNEVYGGTANCYGFPVSAAINELEELEIEFAPASNSQFAYGTVPIT